MSVPSTFLGQLFTRKVFAFAGNSLLLYDYLLTLSLEIACIWNAPWTFVKALFLINRYGNLIGQTFMMLEETGYLSRGSQEFCKAFQLYSQFFGAFSGESIRYLVVLRACAILRCKRSITVLLQTLYILFAIALFAMVYSEVTSVSFQSEYLSEVGVCIMPVPPNAWTFWLILLFLDAFVLAVVGYNLYRLTRGSRGIHPMRFIHLLARDTLLFYLAALFNVLFAIVCWSVYSQDPRNAIQILITSPFLSIIGQRVILNLREFRTQPDSTHSIGQEVDRQIAAMLDDLSYHQPGCELGGSARNRTSSGMIRMADLRSNHGPDQGKRDALGHGVPQEWESNGVGGEGANELGVRPVSLLEGVK